MFEIPNDVRSSVALLACSLLAAAACSGPASEGSATTQRTQPTVTTTTTSAAQPTTSTPAGGYTSAITDEVVDHPGLDSVERRVVDRIGRADLPGASLLVVQDGELIEQEAWGDYTLATVVPIASGSKWLTAATIMTLVDEGKLDLDEPIASYLPEAEGTDVGDVTTRHLLSLTSGLADERAAPCPETGEGTLQECARQIAAAGLVHPPGTAFRYGSQHMHVAGALAEIVTGESFADLFQERIAKPLGMTSTMFRGIGSRDIENVVHPLPAGSAVSTLGDYGRFLEMLSHDGVAPDGTRILSAEAIAEMRTNHTETVRYAAAAPHRMASEAPYALGSWIDWTDADGEAVVLSSDGKFGFRPWIDTSNDLFAVYLVEDRGSGYVQGDPDASADDGGKVHTSGLFIYEWVAEAVGDPLPKEYFPHRS